MASDKTQQWRGWHPRYDKNLNNGPKLKRFAKMIADEIENVASPEKLIAQGLLMNLWAEVFKLCPDGHLDGWTEEDICKAAGWSGDPKQFITALMDCGRAPYSPGKVGFLEKKEDGYHIHHWKEWQNDIVGHREKYREWTQKRRERAREFYEKEREKERLRQEEIEAESNLSKPQIETPQDQTVARYILLAKKLKNPHSMGVIRDWLTAKVAQGHAAKLEEILMNPNHIGMNTYELDKMYFGVSSVDFDKKAKDEFLRKTTNAEY